MAYVRDYRALLSSNSSWNQPVGGTYTPKAVILTYSFAQQRPPLAEGVDYDDLSFFRPLDGSESQMFRQALNAWASVSGITFVEAASGLGDIEVGVYDLAGNTAGVGSMPHSGFYQSSSGPAMYAAGNFGYQGIFLDRQTVVDLHVMLH
ncbi:MAG TPA: hypothetical protein VGB81_10585, partial [Devosia sp.]